MRCEQLKDLIGRHRDGELEQADADTVGRHLAQCAACRAEAHDLDRIGSVLAGARWHMPADLDARLQDIAQADEDGELTVEPSLPLAHGRVRSRAASAASFGWHQMAAALVLTALLSSAATWLAMTGVGYGPGAGEATAMRRDAVTAHIRSLLTETTVQIASSDSHAVKPWFAGRVEFAPSVRDLQADGFPLIGGRLDFVGERRVGVTVYKRRLHTINVFMWANDAPAAGPIASMQPEVAAERGYNIVSWRKAGVTYWAVSDLNAGELLQLPGLL